MMLLNEGSVQLSSLEGGVYSQMLQEGLIGGQLTVHQHRQLGSPSVTAMLCSKPSAASGPSEQNEILRS